MGQDTYWAEERLHDRCRQMQSVCGQRHVRSWECILLEHVQERGLAGIVETEELDLFSTPISLEPSFPCAYQQLSVLVRKAQRGEEVEDCQVCQRRVLYGACEMPAGRAGWQYIHLSSD